MVVRPGNYVGFDLRTDGTATNRIVFSAEPSTRTSRRAQPGSDGINLKRGLHHARRFAISGIGRARHPFVTNTGVVIQNSSRPERTGDLHGFSQNVLIQNNVTTRSAAERDLLPNARTTVIRGNTSGVTAGAAST